MRKKNRKELDVKKWRGDGKVREGQRLHEKGRRISSCEITVEQKHRLTHRENSNPGCE